MIASSHDPDELVNVLVPRRLVPQVYRLLADGMSETAPTPSLLAPPPVQDDPQAEEKPWTREEITRLKKLIRTTTPRVILDLTSENVDQRISLREVERAAGRTYPQARADLAGFTQLVRRQFKRDNWPFKVEWAPGGFASYYVDDADVAQWWRES